MTVPADTVIVLAIESATDLVGVALDGDIPAQPPFAAVGGRRHAETLAPAIESLCRDAGVDLSSISAIAVDTGPGLFTGLRVGVATAKALGQALDIGLVGVSSLDVLSAAAMARLVSGPVRQVVAVVDARRGEVFAARYRFDGTGSTSGTGSTDSSAGTDGLSIDPAEHRLSSPALYDPEVLVDELLAEGDGAGSLVVVGDGAARYQALFDRLPGRLSAAPLHGGDLLGPPPEALARLALLRLRRGAATAAPVDVTPEYLREADATINWEQRLPPTQTRPPVQPRSAVDVSGHVR